MSNRNARRRRQIEKSAVTAAQAQAAGGVAFTPQQVAALLNQSGGAGGQLARPLPRTEYQAPFGPGVPLQPAPINVLRPESGRPEPRQYEYPVAANLPGFGDRHVPWKVLRDAADRIGLFRRCIEIRKNEVSTLHWDVVISPHAVERAQQTAPGAARRDVERDMRRRLEPEISRCVEFWERPDRRNGHDFIAWAKKLLEEHFVLDATAIYPRMTFGGDLFSFEILDGSTIKPLVDQYGGRPLPPNPAYQQVLYGFPRGEYIADVDEDGDITDAYPADRLVYRVSNVRTWTPYGYSAVEQALDDGDLYLRRHGWLKAEYTDGVMPAGWLMAGQGQADWSVAQLGEYERALNDYYAGQTQSRQRFRLLPYGMTPDQRADLGEKYRPDYDLHLIKLVAAHFDTTLAELGFTDVGGLGSTGWHEGQADVQDRKATRPTVAWLQALATEISRTFLGMPRELEFRILGLESEDEQNQDDVGAKRVASGRSTLNEDRDRAGLSRYTFPEADKPFISTGRGILFLEGASELGPPGDMISAAKETHAGDWQQPGGQVQPEPAADGVAEVAPTPTAPAPATPTAADVAKADELAAYRRWAKRNPNPRRPFEFVSNSPMEVFADHGEGYLPAPYVFKADGGDPADPKAQPPAETPEQAWPGWEMDAAVAALWAAAITSALTAVLSATDLARDWLNARHQPVDVADARQWLYIHLVPLVEALTPVFGGMHTDGYLVGDRSATAVRNGTAVNWAGWRPGNTQVADELLGADGAGDGLRALLARDRVTITSVAEHRLDELAAVLADALKRGDPVDVLAARLASLLDDPTWAYTVAITETNRASSAAAMRHYETAGVAATDWVLDPQRPCPTCVTNADAGPVPLGQPFPSGDIYPPAHPRCRCVPRPART